MKTGATVLSQPGSHRGSWQGRCAKTGQRSGKGSRWGPEAACQGTGSWPSHDWAASPVTRRQLGSKPRHKKAAGQQAPSQEGSWAASPVTRRQLGSRKL